MIEFLKGLFSSGASTLVDSIGNAIDKLTTTDAEKLALKNQLAKEMNDFQVTMEEKSVEFEKEITTRWTSDNEHIVTRLVRPISYAAVLILFGAVVLSDGNIGTFKINPAYIPVLQTLLATMTISYFGSRGVEKVSKSLKGK